MSRPSAATPAASSSGRLPSIGMQAWARCPPNGAIRLPSRHALIVRAGPQDQTPSTSAPQISTPAGGSPPATSLSQKTDALARRAELVNDIKARARARLGASGQPASGQQTVQTVQTGSAATLQRASEREGLPLSGLAAAAFAGVGVLVFIYKRFFVEQVASAVEVTGSAIAKARSSFLF